jgi:hypothetical protein
MLTNGDNLYSSNLLPAALPYMRKRIDLIAFEFLSRYNQKNPSMVDHPGRKDQVRTGVIILLLYMNLLCMLLKSVDRSAASMLHKQSVMMQCSSNSKHDAYCRNISVIMIHHWLLTRTAATTTAIATAAIGTSAGTDIPHTVQKEVY